VAVVAQAPLMELAAQVVPVLLLLNILYYIMKLFQPV
jgi:hypothetical protein